MAGREHLDPSRADLDGVAGGEQRRRCDALAVHPGSVQRSEVLDLEPIRRHAEDGVRPGDLRVVENKADVVAAPHGQSLRDLDAAPALGAVENGYERGVRALPEDLAEAVVPEPPPAVQARVVAAALAGDPEEVRVGRLSELAVRPHDHGVVAVEVAEPRAAGPGGVRARPGCGATCPHRPNSRRCTCPDRGGDAVEAPLGLVRALDGCAAREGGELEVVGSEGRGIRGGRHDRRLERSRRAAWRSPCRFQTGAGTRSASLWMTGPCAVAGGAPIRRCRVRK